MVFNELSDKNSTQWKTFINEKQNVFTINQVAIYTSKGKIKDSTSSLLPSSLNALSDSYENPNWVLIPGQGFILLAEAKPNIENIFLLELVIINFSAFCLGLALVYIVLYFITRLIIRPIFSLTDTTNEIAMEQNYALRAERFYSDEIGTLAENFNFMLNRIEQDDYILRQERDKAEQARLRAIELSTKMHELTND